MNGFIDRLPEKIMPLANLLGQNRYLTVLWDAFMLSPPLTVFGLIVIVVSNLSFSSDATKGTLPSLFGNGQNATMSIMSVFVTSGIDHYLPKSYSVEDIFGDTVFFASFLIFTSFVVKTAGGEDVTGTLSLDRLGAEGMLIGMIAAFLAEEIYYRVTKRGWQIKVPDGVPPAMTKLFAALILAVATLTAFLVINVVMTGIFSANLYNVVYEVIQKPLIGLGSSLPTTLIALFLVRFSWFFGFRGRIIVNSIMDPIWNTLMFDNLETYQHRKELLYIIIKPSMGTFTVGAGGSGVTLAIVLLMAFVPRKKQYRDIGRLALAPGIFNVNESAVFGLPIVLNATILIPWVVAPLIVTAFNYLVMVTRLVPVPTGVSVPRAVPIIASGVLAINSWLSGMLQVIDLIIVAFIWYPLLKILDKQPDLDTA